MAERFYARHAISGECYAIEVDGDNVTGVSGPLHYTERGNIADHDYDQDDAEWVRDELGLGHFAMVGHDE